MEIELERSKELGTEESSRTETGEPGGDNSVPGEAEEKDKEGGDDRAPVEDTDTESPQPQELDERIDRLEQALERFRELETRREDRFDRLHAELEALRARQHERLKDPVFHAVVQIYDHLTQLILSWKERVLREIDPKTYVSTLEELREDVEILLLQQGVESFEAPGDSFQPTHQTVARTVPTEDEALVGTLATRLRPGFLVGERLLVKERVAVYSLSQKATSTMGENPHG